MNNEHQHDCGWRYATRHLVLLRLRSPRLRARKFGWALAAAALLSAASFGAQSAPAAGSPTHIVVMKQMHYEPSQMAVHAGDTVEWKNEDIFSHTVTADDGSFDSGLIAPGKSWQTIFKSATTLAYHCRPHPNMTAMLVPESGTQEGAHTNPATSGAEENATLKWSPPTTPEQFHPILVNFTAALLPLALLSDILGRIFQRQSLHDAAWWMVLYAAVITPFTAAAGWWWKLTAGSALPPRLITVHQWLGTSAVLLFLILAVWRWSIYKRRASPNLGYLTTALITVLALVYQGTLGGRMLFGR